MHRITRTQKAVTAAVAAGIPALTLHSAQAAGATNPTNPTATSNANTSINTNATNSTNVANNTNSHSNNSSELAVAEIQAIIGMHDARKRLSDSASIARRSSSMLRESSESVFLSGAESFQLPFEPATATSSASASASAAPSGARGAALMPTQTEVMFGANARVPSWRKQPDVVLQRDLFEACTSVHDVPIPDSVRDVPRPPLFRRGANERVDADDGFWKMR